MNKFIKLPTKYLLLILYFALPVFSFIISIILSYFKVNINGELESTFQDNNYLLTLLFIFITVTSEELFFRYDQSDDDTSKKTHLRLFYILLFLILLRIFGVTNDLFVQFGFLVNSFFLFGVLVQNLSLTTDNQRQIIPNKLCYISNITFALMHLVKLDFNFFTSDLRQLFFIIPYVIYLFILGVILSIIRNRYENGLTYTVFIHFSFNIFLFLIDLALSKL